MTAAFELQNCSDADAEFELSEVEPAKGKERDWSFAFSEAKGVLGPNERRSFELTLTCGRARALRTVIRCGVLVGGVSCSEQKISARADVVAPYACLSSTKIDVGVTYLNVAVERTVKIRNLTQLPSSFEWLPDDLLSEEDATKVQVGLSPNEYTHTVSPQCFGGERSLTRCLAGVRLTCACGAAVRTASSHLVHLRHPIIPVHALFSRSVKSLYISELVRSWFGGTCFRTRSVCATLTSRNCPPRID